MKEWKFCIQSLKNLLKERKDLKEALRLSIRQAGFTDVQKLSAYYRFLKKLLTEIPVRREMGPLTDKFHYLIAHSPGNMLKKDQAFRAWLVEFSRSHGSYLDTTASAGALDSFISDPSYRIEEYDAGTSGWLTFNQFFTRHVKPGMRPVDGRCDTAIVVSPADSVFKGWWPLNEASSLTAKGVVYSVKDLLDGSPYQERFRNGIFTHSYLDTTDYHRIHVPVAGTILEARKIPGDVIVDTVRNQSGELETQVDVGFQFSQTRALVVIESAVGLVALLPIGMGHVSSVVLTAAAGISLAKGEEFGYFAYGGSDMVMLFEAGKINFTAETGKHYKQGQQVARQ
jgi:phosphatidylserine decarboxylase